MEKLMFMNLPRAGMAIVALALIGGAHAQQYPSKPIRMVLPFPPGAPSDIIGRALGMLGIDAYLFTRFRKAGWL